MYIIIKSNFVWPSSCHLLWVTTKMIESVTDSNSPWQIDQFFQYTALNNEQIETVTRCLNRPIEETDNVNNVYLHILFLNMFLIIASSDMLVFPLDCVTDITWYVCAWSIMIRIKIWEWKHLWLYTMWAKDSVPLGRIAVFPAFYVTIIKQM